MRSVARKVCLWYPNFNPREAGRNLCKTADGLTRTAVNASPLVRGIKMHRGDRRCLDNASMIKRLCALIHELPARGNHAQEHKGEGVRCRARMWG
jgi:hypothetical protein